MHWERWISKGFWRACFAVAAALLAVGLIPVLTGPSVPFFDPDSPAYFFPHAAYMETRHFVIPSDRHFLYPLFIHSASGLNANYRAVGILQKLLHGLGGLLLAAALVLVLRRYAPWRLSQVMVLAGLFLGAYFCCKPVSLYVLTMMPEALGGVLCGLLVLLTVLFYSTPRKVYLVCLAVLCAVFFFVKPNFGFAIVYPVFLALLRFKALRWSGLASVILSLALSVFLFNSIQINSFRGKNWSERTHGPETLFLWNLPGVLPEMDAALQADAMEPMPKETLREIRAYLEDELARQRQLPAHRQYPSLGFNPDLFLYGENPILKVFERLKLDDRWQVKFYNHFVAAYIRHHPVVFVQKILRELYASTFMLQPKLSFFDKQRFADLSAMSERSFSFFTVPQYPCPSCVTTYMDAYHAQFAPGCWDYPLVYDALARCVTWTTALLMVVFIVAMAVLVAVSCFQKKVVGNTLQRNDIFILCCALYMVVLLGDVTIAVYHTFDIQRYLVLLLPVRLFVVFLFAVGGILRIRSLLASAHAANGAP